MGKVVVKNLGKAFKSYRSMSAKLFDWILPENTARYNLRWALSDISFEIGSGEAVGIVGVNGAGKSTLLKIVAGTLLPSTGGISIDGRVAALLELGMGFHLEFTGRQNTVMGAQLLGYTSEEIENLMPFITDFAEVGDYFDQPLRTYSSGMQMRLAFSVATATRPDILIVDEALSVGDSYFQHKSFDRIRQFREQGTTLLIVSHSPWSIQAICDRAIMLDDGRLIKEGRPDEVLDYYNATLADRTRGLIHLEKQSDGSIKTISGTKEVAVQSVALLNKSGDSVEVLEVGESVTLKVRIRVIHYVKTLVLGFLIKDNLGQPIYGINTLRLGKVLRDVKSGVEAVIDFAFPANLGKGNYSISLSLSRLDSHLDGSYEWTDRAIIFHVVNKDKEDFVGCNWLDAKVLIRSTDDHVVDDNRLQKGFPLE